MEALARRWVAQAGGNAPTNLRPEEVALRLQRRSEAIRRYLDLPAPPMMASKRLWETQWNRQAAAALVRRGYQRLGWTVKLQDMGARTPQTLGQDLEADTGDTAFVDRESAMARLATLRTRGLGAFFAEDEATLLLAAEELFALAADKIGTPPEYPWVDEIAPMVFAQEVFGWPFCPWAVRFAGA